MKTGTLQPELVQVVNNGEDLVRRLTKRFRTWEALAAGNFEALRGWVEEEGLDIWDCLDLDQILRYGGYTVPAWLGAIGLAD